MPLIRKKTSKRGTTHQRTKIRRKVTESRKKRKKEAKKNTQWKSKHKKDPGIPSALPFKEDILAEIEASRRQVEEDKQRRKDAKLQTRTATEPSTAPSAFPTPTIADDPELDTIPPILIDSDLPNLKTVIDTAHAMLCVLDARDPRSFRSTRLEEVITQKDKHLVLVLTKTDLVPREVLAGWLAFLRDQLPGIPVVPFRASDAFISPPAQPATANAKGKQKASLESVSKNSLLAIIAEATKSQTQGETRIAVVGLTNSGKSTLINSVLASPSLPVYKPSIQQPKRATFETTTQGAQPVQVVHAERTFTFIDTPGLGFIQFNSQPGGSRKLTAEEVETSKARDLLLGNRGSFVHWKETDAAAAYIVARAKHQDLMLHYNIPAFVPGNVSGFLGGVARTRNKIRKHGVLDLSDTARSIARDWSLGTLPYFAVPTSGFVLGDLKDPALDACMTLKEMRAAPRPWPVQLDAGAPDERSVDLEALYAAHETRNEKRKNMKMEIDEEGEESSEGESEAEDQEMEPDGDESESAVDETSEEEPPSPEPEPKPKPKKVSFATKSQPAQPTRTAGPNPESALSKSKLAPKPKSKPPPAPRRVGNMVAKKPQVAKVAGEESYAFSKFF